MRCLVRMAALGDCLEVEPGHWCWFEGIMNMGVCPIASDIDEILQRDRYQQENIHQYISP